MHLTSIERLKIINIYYSLTNTSCLNKAKKVSELAKKNTNIYLRIWKILVFVNLFLIGYLSVNVKEGLGRFKCDYERQRKIWECLGTSEKGANVRERS